ncbi:MAG: hypothetical protein KAR79_04470 [Simkaniaceae bacterium]|nr:hypothetical protein [Simkaniaceae bacterium]
MNREIRHRSSHPWIARLIIAMTMLVLSLIGLIISDIYQDGSWNYWRIMVPVFAALCLWLSWYLRRAQHQIAPIKIWQEIAHWFGLFLAAYLISLFVHVGIFGRFEGGLIVITLLALTTFIAGVYIEVTFAIIGLMLGAFSLAAAFLQMYLYSIMIPAALIIAALIFWIIYRSKVKSNFSED